MATTTRQHGRELLVGRAQVLTTGSWPTQMAARCSLPRELEACCEEFRAFYLASHSGRKLAWQTNMGNAGAPAAARPVAMPACAGGWCRHPVGVVA